MATTVVRTPIFRAAASRSYSQALPICGQISDIKTTTLPSKLVVASADNGSPLTRLSVVVRAGPRYETQDNQGAAHLLRITAGLSTRNSSHFAIVRNIQQVGATLTCTTDRETVAYTLEGTYEAVDRSSEFLSDIISEQSFKPWEVAESLPRLRLELASLSPQVRAINFLHRVAFRTGLGNSLFCAKHNVGKISSETLQHYCAQNFIPNRVAVVGLGTDHEQLIKYAQNICLRSGSGDQDPKSVYYGGEVRSEKGGDLAWVAIAGEGGALSNEKEAAAFAVLQRAYGVGPYTKRGVESSGILSKSIKNEDVAVSAVNVSYSDAGLFGALLAGPSANIRNAVIATASAIRSGNVTDGDISRAKKQLKTAVLLDNESGSNFIQSMGSQAVINGKVHTPQQISDLIDSVSPDDVKKAAKKVAGSKLSIASVGNVASVPYLDELK